ncbi:transcription elongation factor SPT6 isoform X1 [Humulus lupulus]|uniref:transcription elongation factor SPT6 isoform X1 n=1 Tax=Humulus lupulus TaxID=3486 RepID=UPI002B4013AB|nr:transcription elongation factor SPT6 isoform X1 [Humulus lupulus]
MEIEGQDGTKVALENDHKTVFGRGFGFSTDDRTVSRRHVALEVKPESTRSEPRVWFEVLGRNPVWVWSEEDEEVRVFRRSEKGELAAGDWFCVSGKGPIWFKLRKIRVEDGEKKRVLEGESELMESLGSGSKFESFDVSGIDPVKEFGFVVMGHEFDLYPKHMIRDVKNWDWFIEEDRNDSGDDDDDDFENKKKKRVGKKRKKKEENEDDDWTGETEDDNDMVVSNVGKVNNRPKYSTRSKDRDKSPHKDTQGSEKSRLKKIDRDDDDDETLGGFIAGDDELDQEEETSGNDEEEEEFDDDEE